MERDLLEDFDPLNQDGSLVVSTLAFADGSSVNLADLFSSNHAPTLTAPLADQTVQEDAPFSLVVPADTFTDEDAGDVLALSASLADGTALPAWLNFDAAVATFSGMPDDAQVGSLDLKVTATDHENLNVSDIFSLTVSNVNEAPTVAAPLADQQATEDATFSFVVPAGTFADVDPGDVLTYSATLADGTSLPAWLSFDPITRAFTGTPDNADVGTLSVVVTAMDTGNLTGSAGSRCRSRIPMMPRQSCARGRSDRSGRFSVYIDNPQHDLRRCGSHSWRYPNLQRHTRRWQPAACVVEFQSELEHVQRHPSCG
jgi:hypothetical protein